MICTRSSIAGAAQAILDRGGWCVLEICVDIPAQSWEVQVLMFHNVVEAVVDTVADELAQNPEHDARITGCDRRTLCPDLSMGAYLCYVAEIPVSLPGG